MKANEDKLWIATFRDVTKYLRERKASQVSTTVENDAISISLTSSLDPEVYSIPLTLKTYIPKDWTSAKLSQGSQSTPLLIQNDEKGSFVVYNLKPGSEGAKLEMGE
jgi:hypothetical protein